MEKFLAVTPGLPVPPGLSPAHMAYRVGSGLCLLGSRLSYPMSGGLMMLSSAGCDGRGDPTLCLRQVLNECRRRDFRGVICDFSGPTLPALVRLAELLSRRLTVYVPEGYARASPRARVLIPSALVCGTLERRLEQSRLEYGDRLALAVEWLREDMLLPASGQGEPISQDALEEQITRLEPAIFFDRGLCAHYYTYMKDRQAHFVIFDSLRSVREKLRTAERMGVTAALLPPEAAEYRE